MSSLRLVFVFALLAAFVLAAPAPAQKRNIQKRSFIVPRTLNPAHPRGLNGMDAMRKVYQKYGWGFIAYEKRHKGGKKGAAGANTTNGTNGAKVNAGNSTGNGTGQVAANPEQNAALFLSPVDIGGQTLNLDFDSGSSDLWVFSTQLSKATIGQHTAFDATKSNTFKLMQGAKFSISYGDGSGAAGIVGTETVNIGGVSVTNQAVELATAVSQSFVQDTNTDGLVGLAFSKLNTVNDGTKKTPQKTFFDNVAPNLAEPVFTADLAADGSGSYEFGRIDTTKFTGQMAWVPVNASSGFWQFDSTSFAVNGKVQQNPTGSKAIADTGTSLLLVDDAVATAYYQQVQGAQNNAQVGGFIYPCNAKLPSISVAVGANYMATIPGSQITFAAVDQANTTCFGGVQSNGGAGLQIYGDTMFKAQFVAFNNGNNSIGLAPKKGIQ